MPITVKDILEADTPEKAKKIQEEHSQICKLIEEQGIKKGKQIRDEEIFDFFNLNERFEQMYEYINRS